MRSVQFFSSAVSESVIERGISRVVANGAGVLAILGGVIGLVGWWGDLPALYRFLPGWASMKVNTAISFIALGGAIVAQVRVRWATADSSWWRRVGLAFSVLVAAVALVTLCEYALGWRTPLDELVVRDLATDPAIAAPGRMSMATATCLFGLGLSLVLIDAWPRRTVCPAEVLALGGIFGGGIGVLGYLFDVEALYDFGPFSTMALPTALLLVLIGIGVLSARPRRGLMEVLTNDRMGGAMLRRMLPPFLILMVGLGWLRVHASERAPLAENLGAAVMLLLVLCVFGIALSWCALMLNRVHDQLDWRRQMHVTLSSCNRLIARSIDRDELARGITKILVVDGVFLRAWLWLESEDQGSVLKWTYLDGERAEAVESFPAGWGDRDWLHRLDLGRANLVPEPWLVAPLQIGSAWRGALVVERKRVDDRRTEEQALVDELATDLTHALRQIRENEEHAKVEEARAQLASIVTSSEDAIVGKDLQGRVTSWNNGAMKIFGYTAEEMCGRSFERLIPEERRYEEQEILHCIREGRTIEAFDTQRLRKDGAVIDVSVSVSPIRNSAGIVIGASKIARDVSRRIVAERDLKAAMRETNRFKVAFDEHAIVAVTDLRGRINYVNDKFCEISGYSREELIGRDHRLVNSGYHSKEVFRELWAKILAGEVWRGELKNRAKNGTAYWVDATIVPFLDAAGKPERFMAIRADITAIKLAQEELARSNQDLEQFAYVASHDLQEPLRAVSGCLQVLQRRYGEGLDEKAIELIGHAVGGSHRMQALIEGLLQFSRVRSTSDGFAPLDLQKALDLALRNLSASIRESGAIVTHDEVLPSLRADHTQMVQLLQNLLGNAVKFRRGPNPEIHVSAEYLADRWILAVKDNGIGIEPRHFERVFVIFQRLHTRTEYPGTGIGLALCRKIMERHGGTIEVESMPLVGTTFRCIFPRSCSILRPQHSAPA